LSLVEIDFRNKKTLGIVSEVLSPKQTKELVKDILPKIKGVTKVINPQKVIDQKDFEVAKWISLNFGFSLPYVFKNFFFPLISLNAHLSPFKLQTKSKFKQEWQSDWSFLTNSHKKILIVVPEESFIFEVTQKLKNHSLPFFSFEKPFTPRKIEKLKDFLKKEKVIVITNKNLALSLIDYFDTIVLYRQGLFFYYDSFKHIFFDYREIIKKIALIKKKELILFDNLPSLEIIKERKESKETNWKINFSLVSNLEDTFKILNSANKVIIFFPQKVFGKGLICQNCFYELKCDVCQSDLVLIEQNDIYCPLCLKKKKLNLEICPSCQHKQTFRIKKIGAKTFVNLIKDNYSNVYLISKKRELQKIESQDKFILLGSLSLVSGLTPSVDVFVFFNFDNFYRSLDPFLREKYLRLLLFFQERAKNIYLFSNLRHPQIERELKEGVFVYRLIEERKTFKLPPFTRIIKLIKGSKDFAKLQKDFLTLKQKITNLTNEEIIGPLLAKPYRLKNKFYLEIVIRAYHDNFNLRKILTHLNYPFDRIKINPPES